MISQKHFDKVVLKLVMVLNLGVELTSISFIPKIYRLALIYDYLTTELQTWNLSKVYIIMLYFSRKEVTTIKLRKRVIHIEERKL